MVDIGNEPKLQNNFGIYEQQLEVVKWQALMQEMQGENFQTRVRTGVAEASFAPFFLVGLTSLLIYCMDRISHTIILENEEPEQDFLVTVNLMLINFDAYKSYS